MNNNYMLAQTFNVWLFLCVFFFNLKLNIQFGKLTIITTIMHILISTVFKMEMK